MCCVAHDQDALYQFSAKAIDGSVFDFDQFDGYVAIIAAIPLLPGMAQFYFELTEKLASLHPFQVACMILPFESTQGHTDPNVSMDWKDDGKCVKLETFKADNLISYLVLKYVESVK
jgi:hypothetical protein